MLQELSTKTNFAQVGEEIGLDLGTQMVKSYQESHPAEVRSYLIGRQIIEKILAQPGCVAIKFVNAINELGQRTLVYVGINEEGQAILQYATVNDKGLLETGKGIVADRAKQDKERDGFDWWISD